jgi:hypothetical protein
MLIQLAVMTSLLKLPADTLSILNELYQEQNENLRKEEQGDIGEDWVKYLIISSIIYYLLLFNLI